MYIVHCLVPYSLPLVWQIIALLTLWDHLWRSLRFIVEHTGMKIKSPFLSFLQAICLVIWGLYIYDLHMVHSKKVRNQSIVLIWRNCPYWIVCIDSIDMFSSYFFLICFPHILNIALCCNKCKCNRKCLGGTFSMFRLFFNYSVTISDIR